MPLKDLFFWTTGGLIAHAPAEQPGPLRVHDAALALARGFPAGRLLLPGETPNPDKLGATTLSTITMLWSEPATSQGPHQTDNLDKAAQALLQGMCRCTWIFCFVLRGCRANLWGDTKVFPFFLSKLDLAKQLGSSNSTTQLSLPFLRSEAAPPSHTHTHTHTCKHPEGCSRLLCFL